VVGEADPYGNEDDDFAVVRYLSEDSVPAAPTSVVALSSQGGKAKLYGQGGKDKDGRVAIAWAVPSNCWDCVSTTGGVAITDYVVDYSSDSGVSWSTFADGTSADAAVMVTGLLNGVGYVFRVSAVNSVGTGVVSVVSGSVVPAPAGCTITGTPGDDVLYGTNGDDHICGLGGNDTIYGKGGNDTLDGGPGNDTLYGGTGKDRLFGRGGADVLKGGRNNDKLYGNGDRDRLYGQGGNDRLVGGSSRDKLYGGKARDILVGGAQKDKLDGGSQKDTARKPGPDVLVSIEIIVL
jgi:Ca2+-binding RTX toxin-like protein